MPQCTLRLIEHFSKSEKFTVSVIFPREGEFVRSCRKAGAAVYIIPFTRLRSLKHPGDFFDFFLKLPRALFSIYYRFIRLKPDIVHFSDFIDAPFYPCASFSGATAVVHLRTCLSKPVLMLCYNWWRFIFSDKTIFISKAVKRCVCGKNNDSAVVYDPAPNKDVFFPKSDNNRPHGNSEFFTTVISVGSIHEYKGQLNILKMAVELNRSVPGMFRYVFVGKIEPGHEPYMDRLKKFVADNDLKQTVTFKGPLEQNALGQTLRDSDIFIHLPVYHEGLGLVILEAMMSGLPVVAFDCGGIAECFSDGVEGILVPHGNIKAASNAVELLARNRLLRTAMGQAGPKRVRKQFDPEVHFKHIEFIYENMIKAKKTV